MNAQQLHDYIIKPTLEYMGGNYNTVEARFLLLCTAAIESDCGHFIKQVGGPALGIWQMEPETEHDIWENCDALSYENFSKLIECLVIDSESAHGTKSIHGKDLITSPMYSCAMARLKYSMDPEPMPEYENGDSADLHAFYRYYKRIYNTPLGASSYQKWVDAIKRNKILDVKL